MSARVPGFAGLSVALATPMDARGRIHVRALRRHVRRMVEGGVDVLMPCGTTGEGATLDSEEQVRVIAASVEEADGRVPVVAGVGANDTARARALARGARGAGAEGILAVTPYYNRPSQEGLRRHFLEIADAGDLPVVLYNVPGRTGVNLLPATALRLAELEPFVAIKEASGSLDQIDTLLAERPEGFRVLAGDDVLTLPLIALGGDGVVSVAANEAPREMAALVRAAAEGRLDDARTLHRRLLPLFRANFIDTNPVPVKAACHLLGMMEPHVRLPLVPLEDDEGLAILARALRHAGLELGPDASGEAGGEGADG